LNFIPAFDKLSPVKLVWRILLTLAVLALLATAMLPFVVPPVATRLLQSRLDQLGVPATVRVGMEYDWTPRGPGFSGCIRVSATDNTWHAFADCGVSFLEWHATVHIPKTRLNETNPTLRLLTAKIPASAVSNLVFDLSFALDASVCRTPSMPVPVWNVQTCIENASVRFCTNDRNFTIDNASLKPTVSGIANHVDYEPLRVRVGSFAVNDILSSNLFASIRFDGAKLLVSEARADICKGQASVYALSLDTKTLNSGITLFIENVDAGEVLSKLKGFRGSASGRLHGKVKLFLREGGRSLRLRDAFLYSSPGAIGKLQLSDSGALTSTLEMAGLDEANRTNVANVLTDVDYSVLKLDLNRTDAQNAVLTIKLEGSATRGATTVPVKLDLSLRGELEQLINTGLKLTKGNKDK